MFFIREGLRFGYRNLVISLIFSFAIVSQIVKAENTNRFRLSPEEVKLAGEDSNKCFRMAQDKEKAGKLDEAKALYYKSAVIRTNVWGKGDSGVCNIALRIGDIEVKEKHPDLARKWYKQSLVGLSKHYGSGDFIITPALLKLAKLEANEKHHQEACSYYDHALALQERKYGENAEQCMSTRISLIEEYLALKDNYEAKKLLTKAISIEKGKNTSSKEYQQLEQLLKQAEAAGTQTSTK